MAGSKKKQATRDDHVKQGSNTKLDSNAKRSENVAQGEKAKQANEDVTEDTGSVNTISKMKRTLSLVGVVLLLALYLLTFVLAIVDNSASLQLFYASVAATIIIPVLIWVYMMIYRLMNKDEKTNQQTAQKMNQETDWKSDKNDN